MYLGKSLKKTGPKIKVRLKIEVFLAKELIFQHAILNMKYSVRFCEMLVDVIHCEKSLILINSKSINKKYLN